MKIQYLGKTIVGKIYNDTIYDAIQYDKYNYCVKDDTEKKNIYPKELFKEIHIICKAKYIGKSDSFGCINGNIYDITSIFEDSDLEVIDESKQTYMYPKNNFEIIPNNINIMENKLLI